MPTILELLKVDLGRLDDTMDVYLHSRIRAAIAEIERSGIVLDTDDQSDMLLVVDYAAWQYRKRDTPHEMPRHLVYRLHNRLLSQKAGAP